MLLLTIYVTNSYRFLRGFSNLNYEVKAKEKKFMHEAIDIIASPGRFYSLETIQNDWERSAVEKAGKVLFEPSEPFPFYRPDGEKIVEMPNDYLFFSNRSDHLRITDDMSAHVIWEIDLPDRLKRGFLIFLGETSTAGTDVFAVSKDMKEWHPLRIERSSQIVEAVKDLNIFKDTKKIYIKFYESKLSNVLCYGYMVLAETY